MSDPLPDLAPAQLERLALVVEECAEAIQAAMKIQRHGYASAHPFPERGRTNNLADLERELGDVRAAMIFLCESGDVSKAKIHDYADAKLARYRDGLYLHHQPKGVSRG